MTIDASKNRNKITRAFTPPNISLNVALLVRYTVVGMSVLN